MVLGIFFKNKRITTFLLAVIACLIQLTVGWTQQRILWTLAAPFISLCFLLALNTLVLYIYIKYFLSPNTLNKQQDNNFKPLRFTHKSVWPRLEKQRQAENTANKPGFDDPEISLAFNKLLQYVVRDFIESWFVKITGTIKEQTFPFAVDHIIRSAAHKVTERLESTDLLYLVLNRIIPKMTLHISDFRAAEMSLLGRSLERSVTQSDELDLLLASQFRTGKLHVALTTAAVTTKPTETAYLRNILERVLPLIIDEKELSSGPVRVIIREVVSNSILQPVMDMLADPDFWNQTIDTYLGKAIIEQKMVRQLREVLNRHSTNEMDPDQVMEELDTSINESSNSSSVFKKTKRSKMGPKSQFSSAYLGTGIEWMDHNEDTDDGKSKFGFGSIKAGKRAFQDFLKAIQEEKNLLDLKRVRNDIVTQLRKKKAQIVDRDPEEIMDGERVQDIIVHINRLGVAKKRVDKRIATLNGEQFDFRKSTSQLFGVGSRKPSVSQHGVGYSLRDILTNTAGLSYFMEFMDRRGDMVKLQFWLLVEGFNSTDARDEKTFLQDVKMVYEMYFTDTAPHRLHIADQLNKDMKNAIQLADESSEEELFDDRVRELGLRLNRIQQHIFWEIEKEHFPYFKRSDLYFKFLASSPSLASNSIPEDIHAHKKTMPSNTSITNVGESPQPARRSLDENTLYRSSPIRPASATESTLDKSHLLLKEETDSKKADSDSEITTATILKRANESDTASSASVDSALPSPHSLSTPLNASGFGRFRGHQRALSDTSKPNTSRFLSFSNMFTWNGELRKPPPSTMSSTIKPMTAPSVIPTKSASAALPKKTGEPMKRATSSEKKKKRKETSGFEDDEDPLMIEEDEELDEEDDDEVEELLDSLKPKRNRLVRRNTVDAVEAELRSILDGSILDEPIVEEEIFDDGESTSSKKTIQKDTDAVNQQIRPDSSKKVAPKKGGLTSSSSVLLLSGSKGMKSTTAVPVQNPYTLPSWTSSGGTNTISEIEHDSLESIIGAKKAEKRADDDVKSMTSETSSSNVHFAPPGDLLLESKVQKLSEEVEKLIAQEAIVDALIEKAEKQDKLEELRILKKSKAIFRQELQQIKYQKSQYELQESENVLVPGRSRVSITSSTIGSDKHGDFALYVIEIQQLGVDGNYASGWIVARRYSEFFALHQKLKDHHPVVKLIEFPAKWPLLKLQKQFVEARRLSLEKYLRRLVEDKHICKSQELRAFLSQQNIYIPGPDTDWPFGSLFNFESSHSKKATAVDMQPSSSSSSLQSLTTPSVQNLQKSIQQASIDTTLPVNQDTNNKGFMRHIYKTVAAGIDDILIGPSMLDLITQRLSEQVTEFYQGSNDEMVSPPASTSSSKRLHDPPPEDVPAPPVADLPELKAEGITRFTEPLCDLFIEMFELKDKTNWLRRQAVVIILQQILEGTIERKLREFLKYLSSSSMIVFYFNKITDSLWPNGGPLTFKVARKPEEKSLTREEANRKLSTWLPDLLGNMVGRQNARKGARRLFTVLQNKRLNQDLVYTLLDEIIYSVFPELERI